MKHRKLVEDFLVRDERFRERKNKDKGIVILLTEIYPSILLPIKQDLNQLTQIVKDYATMDRAWRKILQERKELRGGDYGDKEELEEEKKEELGYYELKQVSFPYKD